MTISKLSEATTFFISFYLEEKVVGSTTFSSGDSSTTPQPFSAYFYASDFKESGYPISPDAIF